MKKYSENLFPNFRSYSQYWEQRTYVQDCLVELALQGKLFLTDVFNQPNRYAFELAEQVLRGTMVQDKRYVPCPVPYELEEYRISIAPIYGDTVRYEAGFVQVGQLANGLPQLEKTFREYKLKKNQKSISLPAPEAWVALGRYGKSVRSARSARLQADLWRYEEVRPQPQGELNV